MSQPKLSHFQTNQSSKNPLATFFQICFQMKQLKRHSVISKNLVMLFVFVASFFSTLQAQDGDPKAGKALFNAKCAACHKLDKDMTGPMLRNVEARLVEEEGLDREWIYSWVRNSSALIKSGDSYANKVFNKWNKVAMNSFAELKDEEISNILAYTAEPPPPPPPPTEKIDGEPATSGSNTIILAALALLFGLLVVALYLVNQTLRRFATEKGIDVSKPKRTPLWKAFVQNQFLVFCTAIFFLLSSAYFVYGYLSQVGNDQGYAPVQPIHYSHRIHAGNSKIDCKYCHSSARVSKHSGIPSLNICMNCHKQIANVADSTQQKGLKEFGVDYNKEIEKLYAATGWDGTKFSGESKPVQWIRIHNLPDFAYFNHSQHVSVGGIECQECHGPVEEMEIMYQYSPLTMGWCIDCHRQTNIKIKDNKYYEKIHEQLTEKYGDLSQIKVSQMGGLECGKCHY